MRNLFLTAASLSLLLFSSSQAGNTANIGLFTATQQISVPPLVAVSPTKMKATAPSLEPLPVQDPATPLARTESNWVAAHNENVEKAQRGGIDIAFFGDSITQNMDRITVRKEFGDKADTFGIGGDRTQNLLWRMQNGELNFPKNQQPKVVVLLIGTNNLWKWGGVQITSDHETALGILAVVDECAKRLPNTKLIVLGVFPRKEKHDDPLRAHVAATNAEVKKALAGKDNVKWYDIGKIFTDHNGNISRNIMDDYLHPTPGGYQLMFDAIKPHVDVALDHT
jgi:beta-glucosidase